MRPTRRSSGRLPIFRRLRRRSIRPLRRRWATNRSNSVRSPSDSSPTGGMRIEPILGRLRAAPAQPATALPDEVVRTAPPPPPPALPEEAAEGFADHDEGDE